MDFINFPLSSLNTTPPAATATPPPKSQPHHPPTSAAAAPTYENQSGLGLVGVGVSDVISHSTASESQSYASSHSANPSPLIPSSQWPSSSSRVNGGSSNWPRPQVPPKPKKPDPGAIYQVRNTICRR